MVIPAGTLSSSLIERLTLLCRETLREIVLAPSVEIRAIDVDVFESSRFDSVVPRKYYVIRISTNDAAMVRGAVAGAFKGSYKERIEAILNHEVKRSDPMGTAHVEIEGTETNTVDRLIPVRSFTRSKKLASNAPIVKTATKYAIDYIQIRGRHLIAPSPAIAEFLESYAAQNASKIRRAVDFFAGTGIASKVLLRVAQPEQVILVENDPMKISGIRRHLSDKRVEVLQSDALGFSFVGNYDLAVADPYYEDVHAFLDAQMDNLRRFVEVLILVPGDAEDRTWNASIVSRLEGSKFRVQIHELYGQVVLEVHKEPGGPN